MKPKILEKDLQKIVIEYLNLRKDIYFIRNNSVASKILRPNGSIGWLNNKKAGSPDLILCFKGQWIGLELKGNSKQSDLQKQAQQDIERCGGRYYIVRQLEDVIKILK